MVSTVAYTMVMSFENINNPANDFAALMETWNTIQVLGRNDVENAAGPRIIEEVQSGKISATEGRRQMQALLESKQDH